MKKNIAKNTFIISIGTNFSRFLGLARDVIIAKFFGTSYEAGAFVIAFTLPNLLRDFIGEGAANAAFVPVLTEYKVKYDREKFWQVASNLLKVVTVVLIAITFAGVLLAPVLVKLMAPGFVKDTAAFNITISLTRWMFPYIIFMGLTAYSMGVLNTLNHFVVPAFAPGLLNVALIVVTLFLCPRIGVYGLAVGVILGGILQLLIYIPVLRKYGFKSQRGIDFREPAVTKSVSLLAPRIIGSAVYQVSVIFNRMLASLVWVVGPGAIPALYYSYRLIQYPIGIFSNALGTAVLPVMSHQVVENNMEELKKTVSFSLVSVFLVMVPSTVGLCVLGHPLIRVIFQRGVFDSYSTDITYLALVYYSLGLFAYGGIRILATCFYALGDTRTPVKVAVRSLAVNIVCNLIFMWPLKVGGLALATSVAAIYNFFMLFYLLRNRLGGLDDKKIFGTSLKIFLAAIPMGALCYFSGLYIFHGFASGGTLVNVGRVLGIVTVSTAVFFVTAYILRIEEVSKLFKWILKKR